jgi:hypothetical protein
VSSPPVGLAAAGGSARRPDLAGQILLDGPIPDRLF